MKLTTLLTVSLIRTSSALMPCTTNAFSGILPSNTTVLFAVEVPDNGTFGVAADLAYPKVAANLPALCAVSFNVTSSSTSSFTFGMFLPKVWNSRLFTAGNGGFWGGINWIDMAQGTHYGAATVSTDTGHNVSSSGDATWAYQSPEKIVDWSGRALHSSVIQAKEIVTAYYGSRADYSYYSGCSTGGFQGMKEIQNYPDDFDGALVGSPAWWHSHLQTWSIQVALWNQPPNASYHIPDALFPVIEAEVMRQCDGADGVTDGIISAPSSCDFHPEALLCVPSTANKSACLTSSQIDTVYKIYRPWYAPDNSYIFPQYAYGGEFQWSLLSTGAQDSQFSEQFFKDVIFQNHNWTVSNFSYQTVLDTERIGGALGLDADNFDLTPFESRSGKLLHYVGLADGLIPAGSSEYLYNHVARTMAPLGTNVSDFYRLFPIPGMGHCAGTSSMTVAPWYINAAGQASALGTGVRGVPGFQDADHDAVRALIQWVEAGDAPKHIIATKFKNDTVSDGVIQQRPVCMYPGLAKFKGGDVTKAQNWYCEEQKVTC